MQHRKAFIATFLDNEFEASFTGRELADDRRSRKLNEAAKYDHEAMKKTHKDVYWLGNIFDYGTGIRIQTWRDKNWMLMTYKTVNPEFWLPDPDGNSLENDYEYHLFEWQSSVQQLKYVNNNTPNTYFNLDEVKTSSLTELDNGRLQDKKNHRLLSTADDYRKAIITLDCYITLNGRKYLATVVNDKSLLIRFEEIKPFSKEEKKNPGKIPFPVNITQLMPLYEDPYGFAPLEGIIDKQNAINRLYNLAIIQEQQSVFRKYIVDTDIVSNVNLLTTPNDKWSLYIPAHTHKPGGISNAVQPINDHFWADPNKINLSDRIDHLVQLQTGFSDLARGVSSPWETATEAQIQTINANQLFSLDATMLGIGERFFWQDMWYRSLQVYLLETDKKLFRIGAGITWKTVELTRNDLLSGIDPDIKVVSKRKRRDDNRRKLTTMLQQQAIVLQDPGIPEVSKNIFRRKLYELQEVDYELIEIFVPMTPDETRAMWYLEILNANQKPKWLFKPGMDLLTYWIYLGRAEDTEAKEVVMAELQNKLSEWPQGWAMPGMPWQPWQPWAWGEMWPWGFQNLANNVAAQQTSALIQEWSRSVPSIQQGI